MTSIPKGYKQTEIGIIPEDWEYSLLEENSKRGSGHTPNKKKDEYYNGNIVWVSLADSSRLDKGKINSSKITISKQGIANSSAVLHPKGVVLMSRDAGIGKSAVADCNLCVSQHFITWLCNEKTLHNWYLYFWLQFKKKEFENIAIGSTIKTIGLQFFKQYKLPLPRYKEQTAIAEALSDTDELLTTLEKLIEKKKLIKKGTMQELLTGKKRLPGFEKKRGYRQTEVGLIPEDWEVKSVGDVITFQGGSQPPLTTFRPVYKEGYIRLLQIRDYKTNKYETYIPKYLARRFCNKEDIMIGRYGPPIFQILKGLEGAYNVALLKAIPTDKIVKEYAYYFLKQDIIFNFVEKLSQRSSGQTGVDLPQLKSYPLGLPSVPEQTAIAETLSDMDSEIEMLEKKLEKTKHIKQGMMQELLTGKTRLV